MKMKMKMKKKTMTEFSKKKREKWRESGVEEITMRGSVESNKKGENVERVREQRKSLKVGVEGWAEGKKKRISREGTNQITGPKKAT
jgi:hypothetical protein